MAAPQDNEKDIRDGLKSGKYKVDPLILNALDIILSDYLVSIVLTAKNYIEENTPMDTGHADLILEYSRSMNNVFQKIMHPEKIETNDKDILKQIKSKQSELCKEIRAWLAHHVGNDMQAINFIIGDFVDSELPVPVNLLSERVLPRTEQMREILGALLVQIKKESV